MDVGLVCFTDLFFWPADIKAIPVDWPGAIVEMLRAEREKAQEPDVEVKLLSSVGCFADARMQRERSATIAQSLAQKSRSTSRGQFQTHSPPLPSTLLFEKFLDAAGE